jgi:hypothetical protein
MWGDERARLTVPDVAFFLMSLAILGILWPVWNTYFVARQDAISTPTAWLLRLMLPFAILVMMGMLWRKATAGVAR